MRATFEEKLNVAVAHRPPKIVAGAPSIFEVTRPIEHMPGVGPDPRKRYSTTTIGPVPEHRQMAFHLPSEPSHYADYFAREVRVVHLRAVRMRAEWSTPSHVARLEWFTWEPLDGSSAYAAVRSARGILDSLVRITDGLQMWGAGAHESTPSRELVAMIVRLRSDAMLLHEYGKSLASGADEWLATPTAEPQRPVERDRHSRW